MNGVGNFYHSTWVDAIAGGNPFNPIRLYSQMHPERDINWYNQMSSALGAKRTAQEIDGDFLSSGNTVMIKYKEEGRCFYCGLINLEK